ncbi:MAG: CvpA family protein [Thermoguttaceae bacterium]
MMEPYDILMLAVVVLATLFGAKKGMAWQLASLASLIASAIVAIRFHRALAPYISTQAPWNQFIAMLILYLGTSLAIWLAFRVVAGFIDRVKLQDFDRQVGGLFGFAKGVLLCVVVTFFAVTLSEWARQRILKTYSGRYIALLLEKGTPLLPDDLRRVLGKYIEELDRKLDPGTPPEGPPSLERDPPGQTGWDTGTGVRSEPLRPSEPAGSSPAVQPWPTGPRQPEQTGPEPIPEGFERVSRARRQPKDPGFSRVCWPADRT